MSEQKKAIMTQARNVMGGGFLNKPATKVSRVTPSPVKKIQQDAGKLQRQTQCQHIFRAPVTRAWFPTSGSQAYRSEMARCMKEKGRNSYGPDILGLRLGMSEKKARSVMQRQRFSSRASTDDPRPFHDATLQWTRDDTHGIALYYLYSGGEKRLAAVSRRLYFDNKNTRIDQVRDGLRKKYGKESQASASGTLLWVGKGKSGTRSCKRLEKKLAERTDWSRKWKAPRVRGSQSMSTGSAQSVSQACMSKYGFKPGMMPGAGTFDISKMMGLQQCMSQQAGKMIPGSSGRKQRATMMIAKEGAPQDYQKFASCGPVIIASQHNDASGKLTDVSLVLFDPAWLAELPAYLFKQSGSTGDIQF
ncbi:MAG TPA: hypothetical protein ENI67_07055 [Gammaproteobacteria bacterium]|nr:hypothetical protein [Gammaproteobacteria bacterium]